MSEDANDVTKALAAFGAPLIRYHSFGQAQLRSSMVLPRRPAAATLSPVLLNEDGSPVLTQQEEPVAAPESRPVSPLFPQPSTVAPPPRPLAEWAAPVGGVPVGSIGPTPMAAESGHIAETPAATVWPTSPVVTGMPEDAVSPNSFNSLPEIFEFLAAS